jgi:GT2 family glycosyltransferase
MTRRPTLTVVVPARNAARHIDRCLAALLAQRNDLPIVVVDGGSEDDTAARARRWGATVIDTSGATAAQARNAGAGVASTDAVVFVDADNEVRGRWLEACEEALTDEAIAAAGQPYRTVDAPTWVQSVYDALRARPSTREPIEWLGAGNLAIRRDAFEAVGGFDTSLHTCEDVALCVDLRGRGFRLMAEPGMESVHHGDPATLGALFRGELWRGRDNVRVSLRRPRSFRSLAGLAVSAAAAAGLLLLVAGLVIWPWLGVLPTVAGAGLVGLAVVTRTALMARAAGAGQTGIVAVLAVAATYEVARGVSLLYPGSHETRTGTPLVKHEA